MHPKYVIALLETRNLTVGLAKVELLAVGIFTLEYAARVYAAPEAYPVSCTPVANESIMEPPIFLQRECMYYNNKAT